MKRYSTIKKFSVALALGTSLLVGGAYVMAQREAEPKPAAIATVKELSSVFRDVSQNVIPSIVSIRTESTRQLTQQKMPFNQDDVPFFFRNNPEFKKFFENQKSPREQRQRGQGSGFIISDSGLVITNSHVVKDADEIVAYLNDGREIEATVVGMDPRSDVAVLQLAETDSLIPAKLGNSDEVQVGDWVLAMGSPFGLEMTVTAGIISAKGRGPGINDREDYLQTDAAINPGNSGGPLLNINGEVIGINTAISSRSGGYDGIGFTIPINMANFSIDQIVENGSVKRAFLGVGIQEMDRNIRNSLGIDANYGVLISNVQAKSPAEESGIVAGDVILEFNGQKVDTPRKLQGIVEVLRPEKAYSMVVLRDGEQKSLEVTLSEMPDSFTKASFDPDEEEQEEAAEEVEQEELAGLGVEVQELNAEIANQLGLKMTSGVVITSVDDEGPAAEVGLTPGLVIAQVGSTKVNSVDELKAALEEASLEKGVLLLVKSRNGARFVAIKK
ncbi:putative periplasmic serine endoprotease DegP-like precursor [Polystyrenella longa]|uniref:Putative periplasmic serine endoprotease DegP-like n=1 Tax=Polystyrenella longa TaxID=2528007 RepID=A0A518CRJ5_9PLAN|nr:Do family serine endopeptidase [Polystyrenella longa]QDU81835.1 putative periplasmic serine endoprotease DegP-like precursor [Polystyrenella longa]